MGRGKYGPPTTTQEIRHVFRSDDLTSGNNLDGIYSDTTTISDDYELGVWTLDRMYLRDEAGNQIRLNTDELKDLGIQTTIELTSGDGDINAPSIRSYQLPTYTVDLSNGDVNLGSTANKRSVDRGGGNR